MGPGRIRASSCACQKNCFAKLGAFPGSKFNHATPVPSASVAVFVVFLRARAVMKNLCTLHIEALLQGAKAPETHPEADTPPPSAKTLQRPRPRKGQPTPAATSARRSWIAAAGLEACFASSKIRESLIMLRLTYLAAFMLGEEFAHSANLSCISISEGQPRHTVKNNENIGVFIPARSAFAS